MTAEWLETDGMGGFAMGTADGIRTRRYHALLLPALRPPDKRMVLVADLEVHVETAAGRFALSSHRYRGGAVHPDGASRLVAFAHEPWPRWEWQLPDARIACELAVTWWGPVVLRWTVTAGAALWLHVQPLLAGRDYHALHHENPVFRFDAEQPGAERVIWRPYPGVPAISAFANAIYQHAPDWYRGFDLIEEAARGLDHEEDLAMPGTFTFDLSVGPAALALSTPGFTEDPFGPASSGGAASRAGSPSDGAGSRNDGPHVGAASGGSASGEASSTGAASGGASMGGGGGSGGAASAGAASSGAASSGAASSGGASKGEASMGEASMGAATMGGAPMGPSSGGAAASGPPHVGASSGGASTGGASNGGASSGDGDAARAAALLGELPSDRPIGAAAFVDQMFAREAERRAGFASPLERAADAYIVMRVDGYLRGRLGPKEPGFRTIIAGYPWFADWGRDTFISLRGLCLATGRRDDARAILGEWARVISNGMLPNRFDERDATPEYNSVDAALWFVVAADAYLAGGDDPQLRAAIAEIVDGYAAGTRHGIRMSDDGLLACGEPGVQLTWMDARVDDECITPRIGKPVEIQALWINALLIAGRSAEQAKASFARFWNPQLRCLYDVIDADHVAGAVDASLRPNQIFAVGGLPHAVLTGDRARAVVDTVERALWTPAGPRSLAPGDPRYHGRYLGDPRERDRGYHNGPVWPWLAGAFIEAWLRVYNDPAAARAKFLTPLLAHAAASGHLAEIYDGDPPHTAAGCPFQAWSLAELIRVDALITTSLSRLPPAPAASR